MANLVYWGGESGLMGALVGVGVTSLVSGVFGLAQVA